MVAYSPSIGCVANQYVKAVGRGQGNTAKNREQNNCCGDKTRDAPVSLPVIWLSLGIRGQGSTFNYMVYNTVTICGRWGYHTKSERGVAGLLSEALRNLIE